MTTRREFLKTTAVVPIAGTSAIPEDKQSNRGQEILKALHSVGLTVGPCKITVPTEQRQERSNACGQICQYIREWVHENNLHRDWVPARFGDPEDAEAYLRFRAFVDEAEASVNDIYSRCKQLNKPACKKEIRRAVIRRLLLEDINAQKQYKFR